MRYLLFVGLVFAVAVAAQEAPTESRATPCLLVRPTEGFQTAFGRLGSKYEYMDSFNVPKPKMVYKKKELEKLQRAGVHVVLINHNATFHEVQEARESCTAEAK